jgi:hypothetical protein
MGDLEHSGRLAQWSQLGLSPQQSLSNTQLAKPLASWKNAHPGFPGVPTFHLGMLSTLGNDQMGYAR